MTNTSYNPRQYCNHKTVAHAFAEYKILKKKNTNATLRCAVGTSTPYIAPKITIEKTICDNGARNINRYYLKGVPVNAHGFKLNKSNLEHIKINKCKGCNNFRCSSYKYYSNSTANTNNKRYNNYNHKYPAPSPYYMGPLPIYKQFKQKQKCN